MDPKSQDSPFKDPNIGPPICRNSHINYDEPDLQGGI